jgi:membrane protease YdiL (CAAX protease family)
VTGPNAFQAFVETWKPLLPAPLLVVIAFVVWLFFRGVWRELDEDALLYRAEIHAKGKMDLRPFVALLMTAIILAMQEYYGNRIWFDVGLVPVMKKLEAAHPGFKYAKYDELWAFAWWAFSRIAGYVLPFFLWRLFFPKDSLRDLGFRTKGFFDHVWIYGLFLAVVVPAMFVVAQAPDFGSYYPFYKQSSRSWFDFLTWEAMYFAQFFALEMFFRGFILGALRRSFGSGAIFAMCVPYCMIHFGKPYLEACGAIIAGVALGSLSMKTKSIYQGFMLHITVAALMDWLSLRHRKATPIHWLPQDETGLKTLRQILDDEAQREAIASRVERGAGVVFLVLVTFLIVMFWRSRRRRLERMWLLPEPKA